MATSNVGPACDDIIIHLATGSEPGGSDYSIKYNISKFMKEHCSQTFRTCMINYHVTQFLRADDHHEISRTDLDQFVVDLDKKVCVKRSDPMSKRIVHGIERIVEVVCRELAAIDSRFHNVVSIPAGSMYAGFKVGLPHEADIMLQISDQSERFKLQEFYKLVLNIWKEKNLKTEFKDWTIHGVSEHRAGVCLVMEYNPSDHGETCDALGVTIDLVPVYKVERGKLNITRKAKTYLKYCKIEKECHRSVFQLAAHYEGMDDSGVIEKLLLQTLDEDVSRGFRVAKYILQQYCYEPEAQYTGIIDKTRSVTLYGYKPYVKSFHLRLCLLLLLINTHGTELTAYLKGGMLTLCLLDMVKSILDSDRRWLNYSDPLGIRVGHYHTFGFSNTAGVELDSTINDFLTNATCNDLSAYALFNTNFEARAKKSAQNRTERMATRSDDRPEYTGPSLCSMQ